MKQTDLEERIQELLDDPSKPREIVSDVPMAPPVGYKKQPSMIDNIRALVRSEHLRQAALENDMETFDEADDFDVGDDFDPRAPYEESFDPSTGMNSYDPGFAREHLSQAAKAAEASAPNPPSDGPPSPPQAPKEPTQAS